MTEQNRVAPQYQEMAQMKAERLATPEAQSDTQAQMLEMQTGERWSSEVTMRVYGAGGNQAAETAEGQARSYGNP